MNQYRVILYTGKGCHLCNTALELLSSVLPQGWQLNEVSISDSPVLRDQYGLRIPVVKIQDGGEKGWPFTGAQLKKLFSEAEQSNQN